MAYENLSEGLLNYFPCQYEGSKLLFRGPRRRLSGDYVAYLGGTETYGKFIKSPFPALVEEEHDGDRAVNFGCVNAGLDVYANDPFIVDACRNARVTVIQVLGAHNMTNKYYSVHPRRNDRFLRASQLLRTTYPEVDFTEFNFTRHLLTSLRRQSVDRFKSLEAELKETWLVRMKRLLRKIGGKTVVLWFANDMPDSKLSIETHLRDPLFVDKKMIERIRPLTSEVIFVTPSSVARARGTAGMIFSPMEQPVAEQMLGVFTHHEAARKVSVALERLRK